MPQALYDAEMSRKVVGVKHDNFRSGSKTDFPGKLTRRKEVTR